MLSSTLFVSLAIVALAYEPTIDPYNKPYPHTTEEGQSGYNDCTQDSSSAKCQTLILNSVEDFCLWAPATPGSTIGDTEGDEVAWCTKSGNGARLIPPRTFNSAHWIKTPNYIQITGTGDFTRLNIQRGDEGGELDPKGATGLGNPIGGLVIATVDNKLVQIKDWTSFISYNQFCIRACFGDDSAAWCQHIYDVMGCEWNEPGNYDDGFSTCESDNVKQAMGVYGGSGVSGTSTWYQGQNPTPTAQAPAASSNCVNARSPGANYAVQAAQQTPPPSV